MIAVGILMILVGIAIVVCAVLTVGSMAGATLGCGIVAIALGVLVLVLSAS